MYFCTQNWNDKTNVASLAIIWLSVIICGREDIHRLWTEVCWGRTGAVYQLSSGSGCFKARAAQKIARGCTVLNCTIPLQSFCRSYFKKTCDYFAGTHSCWKITYLETMSALFCYFSQKHTVWPPCTSLVYGCRCLQNDLNISFCIFTLKPDVIYSPHIFPFLPQNTLPIIFLEQKFFNWSARVFASCSSEGSP